MLVLKTILGIVFFICFVLFITGMTIKGFPDGGILCILVFVFFASLMLFLCEYIEKNKEKPEPISIEYQEIKSFALHSNTSTSASGAFCLGCGYIISNGSTELKYYFYKKGQVGYVLCSISASRVELVETDEKPPGIEGVFTDSGDIKKFEYYVIYVPIGTIFEEYKVEL